MVDAGRTHSHDLSVAIGLQDLGMCSFAQGKFKAAVEYLEESLSLIDAIPESLHGYPSMTRTYLCLSVFFLGQKDRAHALLAGTLSGFRDDTEQPYFVAAAYGNACYISQLRGEVEETASLSKFLVEHAEEHGFFTWADLGRFFAHWAALDSAADESELQGMENALEAMSVELIEMTYFFGIAARRFMELGMLEKAERYLKRATKQAQDTGERFFLAELYRIAAELALSTPGCPKSKAVDAYERAIEVAQEQDAKDWLHLAQNDLRRLCAQT